MENKYRTHWYYEKICLKTLEKIFQENPDLDLRGKNPEERERIITRIDNEYDPFCEIYNSLAEIMWKLTLIRLARSNGVNFRKVDGPMMIYDPEGISLFMIEKKITNNEVARHTGLSVRTVQRVKSMEGGASIMAVNEVIKYLQDTYNYNPLVRLLERMPAKLLNGIRINCFFC